jgi:succinate dehydrogenase / fumarate reductase, iron-sulfur subunit
MDFTLHVWRQKRGENNGKLVTYRLHNISSNTSFVEMIDNLNEELILKGEEPIAYDSDCLEGICGMCSMFINGIAHGPQRATTTCQLHMRVFRDGEHITIEPWRSRAFPVVKDLVVDRSAFDRINQAGGFISVNAGGAPDGNAILVSKHAAETAMDGAACIGCGACVASCKNASAMLFVAAKVSMLSHLPQGAPERASRVISMVNAMDKEGFGACTNQFECEAVCPKEISVRFIANLNRELVRAGIIGDA